ncbi:MAG: hypothetical protein SNJ53_01655 [Thermodesulfovibrionales bacterium]
MDFSSSPFKKHLVLPLLLTILIIPTLAWAEIIDRVVAYVDDHAITLYDLKEARKDYKKNNIDIDDKKLIESIINKTLLYKEAKKMRLEASEGKDPINEYIDIKIRSLIFVKEEDIQRFYNENKDRFLEMPLSFAKDKIEQYLIEREVNNQLKRHIQDLRQRSNIVINVDPSTSLE